ncbi:hypothetical protein SEA_KABOCHA_58 [Gordonia phage Kabocha]|uniref:Uncharacterized protein n=1 Tax=Gordonia phage Chidiebere TaxID=2656530 RepID=A0A649VKT7_9CAUD|nr:hypothetical protein PQD14_gp057 [Gordonia phage Chidiebere]AZS07911.1 hypothetical protein PBI_GRAY_57 [Gordonia phage Gray]WAA19844.1 hypothetical protein SEA_KABOCHA_58 [Gordonia phage Kabocha]WAA20034.1 hypothetical protein SEA_HANEM_57 [Gordonia phage Hanem]WNM67077.1 minor tail protein [Gordonia Phage Schomber]QGJ92948.1 hypothetical protein PBI_CHIDIEBERE_57 [Gordonia phage Chidiebere]
MPDEPKYSVTTERIWDKLPDVYTDADVETGYQFKKYVSAIGDILGDVDLLVERLRYRSQIEMEMRKRYAQRNTTYTHKDRVLNAPALGSTSDLVDPRSADRSWLPWLGQLVGVKIDPNTPEFQTRDQIFYASAGYRAGSRDALEKAARTVLNGSRYAMALPHTAVDGSGNLVAGTTWDVTILTRASESPDSVIVLAAVNRDNLKPAGVRLYHRVYTASWDALEAALPFWVDWETATWDQIEQAGISYTNVAGNVMPNPSFEEDIDGWNPLGEITLTRVGGGLDGSGYLRGDFSGPGFKGVESPLFPVTANNPWVWGFNYQCSVPTTVTIRQNITTVQTLELEATTPNTWRRVNSGFLAEVDDNYRLTIATNAGDVNTSLLLDSFVVRKAN